MSHVSGLERVRWSIDGQRFEATVGFLNGESTFFESFFTNYDGSVGEQAAAGVDPAVVKVEVALGDDGKKCFNFAFTKDGSGLDAEWMGSILVFLRRGRKTFNWDEMEVEQKQSFAKLVRVLGIHRLAETVASTPAGPSVSHQNGSASDAQQNGGNDFAQRLAMAQMALVESQMNGGAPVAAAANGSASENDAAARNLAAGMAALANGEREAEYRPIPTDQVRPVHPSIDDDDLEMPMSGCYLCGTAGHDAANCPHKQ